MNTTTGNYRRQRGLANTLPQLVGRTSGHAQVGTRHWAGLGAILLVAAVLRLPHVTQPLVDWFTWRESSTAMMADNFRLGGWNIFYPAVNWTGPGPGYQGREFALVAFLAAVLDQVLGWHDWTGRAVALVFGLLTVLSLHRLAALVWDEAHAHAVALAYAMLPCTIMVETSFLPDPAMLAFVTLGLWLYVRSWVYGSRWGLTLGLSLFTLGVLCKLTGIGAGLCIAWLLIVAMVQRRMTVVASSVIGGGIGLAVVGGYYAWAIHVGSTYPPYHIAGSGYVWELGVGEYLRQQLYLPQAYHWINFFYGTAFLALGLIGLWFYPVKAPSERERPLVVLPLIWLVGCGSVFLVAAKEVVENPWNLHAFSVPAAFLVGRGILVLISLGGTGRGNSLAILRGSLLLVGLFATGTHPMVSQMKEPVAESGRLLGMAVAARKGPGELAILISRTAGDPVALYYARGKGWLFPPYGESADVSEFVEDGAPAIALLDSLRSRGARWFGVTRDSRDWSGRPFLEHHAGLLAYLRSTAVLVEETDNHIIFQLEGDRAGLERKD